VENRGGLRRGKVWLLGPLGRFWETFWGGQAEGRSTDAGADGRASELVAFRRKFPGWEASRSEAGFGGAGWRWLSRRRFWAGELEARLVAVGAGRRLSKEHSGLSRSGRSVRRGWRAFACRRFSGGF